jgi:uncharacterized metal-binding protein YceD (DUF177 family)
MSAPEFSRELDLRSLPPGLVTLTATPEECLALARRFDLVAIRSLEASLTLAADGDAVTATGRLDAAIVQSCAVSGEDLPVTIAEPVALRFVPERPIAEEEIELAEDELDDIPFSGTTFDLGEAIAQSLALAIDPYATGPAAERARQEAALSTPEASGPFAALAALKKG